MCILANADVSTVTLCDLAKTILDDFSGFTCLADLNEDGVVDFADYLEFLNLFGASDARADLNHDGVVDFGDYLEFLNLHAAGC